jgi:hypothetical protein
MASHSIKTVTFYTRLLWLPFGQHALYIYTEWFKSAARCWHPNPDRWMDVD